MTGRSKQRGVTLVETLVSLAIMGMIIGALMVMVGQNTRFTAAMRDRTMAGIAADNLMVEALSLQSALVKGETQGEVEVGEQPFTYTRTVSDSGYPNLLFIEIVVSGENGQALARASTARRQS